LYRDRELPIDETKLELDLEPHSTLAYGVEELFGRFMDVSWAYRFGPPAQDVVVASLELPDGAVGRAFRFPAGRPVEPEPAERLGLTAALDGDLLRLESRRLAYGVRIELEGCRPADDQLTLEPGHTVVVPVRRDKPEAAGWVTALNLVGRIPIEVER
jgi:beta-mannosidase